MMTRYIYSYINVFFISTILLWYVNYVEMKCRYVIRGPLRLICVQPSRVGSLLRIKTVLQHSDIDNDIITYWPNHSSIVIDNNYIEALDKHSFGEWRTFEILSFEHNCIRSIAPDTFRDISVLKLYLSKNLLRIGNNFGHKSLPRDVKALYLSGNPLGFIPSKFFSDRLLLLDLTNSKGGLKLGKFAFAQMKNLKYLSLRNNNIQTLSESVLTGTRLVMGGLLLEENPWICDCNMKWLLLNLTKIAQLRDQPHKYQARCSCPPHLRSQPFSKIINFEYQLYRGMCKFYGL